MGRHQLPGVPVLSQQVSGESCRSCGAVPRPTAAQLPFHDAVQLWGCAKSQLRIHPRCASISSLSVLTGIFAIASLSSGMQVHLLSVMLHVSALMQSAVAKELPCSGLTRRCGARCSDIEVSRCSTCSKSSDLWICLICGHVGCGRYHGGHANSHWQSTQHCYALELQTQSVSTPAASRTSLCLLPPPSPPPPPPPHAPLQLLSSPLCPHCLAVHTERSGHGTI